MRWSVCGRQYFNISSKGSHTSDFISLTVMLLHIHRQSWFVFLFLWNYDCFATMQTVCFSFPSYFFSSSFLQFMTSVLTWADYYTVSDCSCQSVQRAEVMFFATTVGKIMIDDLLQSFCSVSVRENQYNNMECGGGWPWCLRSAMRCCPFKWKAGVYLMQGHAGPALSQLMVLLMKQGYNNWVFYYLGSNVKCLILNRIFRL